MHTPIGWTYNASAYCAEHKPDVPATDDEQPHPIFSWDEIDDMTCDVCHDRIKE